MWGAYRLIDANLNGNWQDVYNAAVYFVSTVVPGGGIIASAPVDIANKIAIIGQCYYKAIDEADWDTHVNAVFGKSDNSLTLEDFGSNPEAKIRDLLSRYALIDDCYGEANYYNLLNNPSKLSSDKRTKAAKVFELYFGVLNNSMKTVTYNRNTFNWQ